MCNIKLYCYNLLYREDVFNLSLGERLKEARKLKGFTQDSLAETIGVSRGVIFNLEKNKTEPQTIVINAISQCLKINKNWLLNGNGEMDNHDDSLQNAEIVSTIQDLVEGLSENDIRYLIDVITSYKKHVNK